MPARRQSRLSVIAIVLPLLFSFNSVVGILPSAVGSSQAQSTPPAQKPDGSPADDAQSRQAEKRRTRSLRKGGRRPSAPSPKKAEATTKGTSAVKEPADPRFARDVAPILVANCVGCHTQDGAGLRRGKLDLSSFELLMKGTPDHPVIVAGKPEESHLYLRVHGDETPSMPQGGDRTLSEAAVARIERWIKAGATLDPGLDPKAPFRSYSASPEELQRLEIAAMSEAERQKRVENAGRERFKQANPRLNPELTPSRYFVLFGNLPKDRPERVLGVLETQYANLRKLLGPAAPSWPEKVSVYVFNDRKDLIEFIRTVEERDVDANARATARLSVAEPYVAVLDPAQGREEAAPVARRRGSRSRRSEVTSRSGFADRTLAGLLTESFTAAAVRSAGKSPGWLASGLGVYFAARVDPQSQDLQNLRSIAADASRNGWDTKVAEVLDGSPEVRPDEIRAVGYALVDWLMSPRLNSQFSHFAAGLIQDPTHLPDVLKSVYGSNRERFIAEAGQWIAGSSGE